MEQQLHKVQYNYNNFHCMNETNIATCEAYNLFYNYTYYNAEANELNEDTF